MGIIRDGKLDVLDHMASCVAFTDQGVLVGNGSYMPFYLMPLGVP